ncbi:MAG: hypothetical protein ABSG00_05355 [Terracidiphilus sp.]|jgi:hypothetical protein
MARVNDFMLKADRDKKAATFEKRRLAWEKNRQSGEMSYIFRYGVLRFGGIMFLCFLSFDVIFDRQKLQGARLPGIIVGYLFIFVIAFFFGLWEWHSNEKRYCNMQKPQDSNIESQMK